MSAFVLRLIALLSMLIDHAGVAFFPQEMTLRVVGRLAFPLYCFLLAEGCAHTRSLLRYGSRLLLLAVLSEVPYDLLLYRRPFSMSGQNVFWTLLLGLLAIAAWQRWAGQRRWLAVLAALGLGGLAFLGQTDYDWLGVLLPLGFYLFRGQPGRQAAAFAVLQGAYLLWMGALGVATPWLALQACALLAVPLLALYNGTRGSAALRWFFYAAYPLHLLLYWFIRSGLPRLGLR